MKQKSVMQHRFGTAPDVKAPRSVFNRSHGWKGTYDAGYIVPILCDIAMPGDTFTLDTTVVARLASPLNKPIMDNLKMDFFFFSVPYRLLWENFKKFYGEQTDPGDSISYTIPQMTIPGGGITEGSLGDYFGLPIGIAAMPLPNSLHFRAYNLIWNEWFRDENLQDSAVVDVDDGPDTLSDYVLLRRGKRYNYFSQALPYPQKGDAVEVPLGSTAPIVSTGYAMSFTDGTDVSGLVGTNSTAMKWTNAAVNVGVGVGISPSGSDPALNNVVGYDDTYPGIEVDLSGATAATVNEWRQAFQLQRLLERDMRSGTRYVERVQAHFGVTSPDARQQRPEYLGGGSCDVNVTTVPQTSESGTTKQGNLVGFATAQRSGIGFSHSFTEHCVVMGLVSVRADLNISSGRLDRMWTCQTREDLYVPVLAQLGEQELLTQELYCDGTGTDDDVFGYIPRWDEYRCKVSTICGAFRSDAAAPLDSYHLAEDYSAAPVLNASYIVDDPPVDRIVAVTSEPHIIMDAYFDYRCVRPIPAQNVPGMIDHF